MERVHIYLQNSETTINQDLLNYLERNLQKIVMEGQVILDFKISTEEDIAYLQTKNIKRLPALLRNNNNNVIGSANIINFLGRKVKAKKHTTVSVKSEEELVREYQMGEMNKNDQEETNKLEDDLLRNADNMIKKRNGETPLKSGFSGGSTMDFQIPSIDQRSNNVDVGDPLNNISNNDAESKMLAQLMEREYK